MISKELKSVGLWYPESFELSLYPGQRCYYVANKYLQLHYDTLDITGTVYTYGFEGWNGHDQSTCTLMRRTPLNTNKLRTYFDNPHYNTVCSYIVLVSNTDRTSPHSVIFETAAASWLAVSGVSLFLLLALF